MSKQVTRALEGVGADKDEDGRFLIYGELPAGLGEEVVVSNRTLYGVAGDKRSLAGLLGSTNCGVAITVIS